MFSEFCSISALSCSLWWWWVGVGVPSDYFVSPQLQLLLFCCWGCGCCWAVTICIVTIDNVCMHYFPFTFSEYPIGNDIFGTIELLMLTTFECLTTKCFYGLIWMTFCICTLAIDTFCIHCCTNFLICYCNGNPLYIDNFYVAKLSPCFNPSSIRAEVVLFSFNPSTHPTNHPSAHKSF